MDTSLELRPYPRGKNDTGGGTQRSEPQPTSVIPLARAPWNDPAIIMNGAGAYGVVCPMINARAQSKAFVRACKHPPKSSTTGSTRESTAPARPAR